MLKQVHVYIKGDVIGVGFRAWTKIQAKIVDIKGWIKNNHTLPEKFGGSGGIEAVIQGPEDRVVEFIDLLRVGPPV
ncbi:MAG TPA: acylphosphatase, partial [Candidatus Nitrosocosmicus sp.]|nr:acylphosphatase [Candidatus Nitrosocosmicus sp.]